MTNFLFVVVNVIIIISIINFVLVIIGKIGSVNWRLQKTGKRMI